MKSAHFHSTCVYSDVFPGWQVANEIAKPQVSINSNNSSIDCKKLQPEMKICNRKQKLTSTRVVYYSSTRGSPSYNPNTNPYPNNKSNPNVCLRNSVTQYSRYLKCSMNGKNSDRNSKSRFSLKNRIKIDRILKF